MSIELDIEWEEQSFLERLYELQLKNHLSDEAMLKFVLETLGTDLEEKYANWLEGAE